MSRIPIVVRRPALAGLAGLALAATAAPVAAATYCVGTVAELRAALQSAQAPGDDEIRIRTGTYLVDATLVHVTAQPGWLAVTGGWFEGGGLPCGGRTTRADATVLDGQGQRQVMVLSYQPGDASTSGARHFVDNLTFQNGVGTGFQRGGGLDIGLFGANATNEVWLENLVVRNSSGYFAGGINAYAANGYVRVVNSLFDGNSAPTTAGAHLAIVVNTSPSAYTRSVVVANSTFAGGTCAGNPGAGYTRGCGLAINMGATPTAEVANSAFFQNQIADLTVEAFGGSASNRIFVRDSLLPVANGTAPAVISSPVTGDPRFVDAAAGNFLPREDSPLLNRGVLPIPGPYTQFNGFDVAGGLRNRLGAIDVGAFELQNLDPVFRDGFEPPPP
jgi:hypothetical protein